MISADNDFNYNINSSPVTVFVTMATVLVWGCLSPSIIVQVFVLVCFGIVHTALTSNVEEDAIVDGGDEEELFDLKCQSNLFVGRFNFGMFGSI